MTEQDKMLSGKIYDPSEEALVQLHRCLSGHHRGKRILRPQRLPADSHAPPALAGSESLPEA